MVRPGLAELRVKELTWRRPLVARRMIEDRFGADAFEHFETASGLGVVVNRAALPALPADDENFIPLAHADEIAAIVLVLELHEAVQVFECDIGFLQQLLKSIDRGAAREAVEIADERENFFRRLGSGHRERGK